MLPAMRLTVVLMERAVVCQRVPAALWLLAVPPVLLALVAVHPGTLRPTHGSACPAGCRPPALGDC